MSRKIRKVRRAARPKAAGDVGRRLDAAVALLRAARWAEGEQALRALLEIAPNQPDALHLLGAAQLEQGRAAEAAELIRAALAARPGVAQYLSNLGNALGALGELDSAEAAYQQAVRADPKHADAWNNLGALHLRRGDLDAADEALRVALRLRPGPLVHANLGDVRVEEGALDDAADHYDAAARALPATRHKAAMLLTPIVDGEADIDAQRAGYAARLTDLEQDPPPLVDPAAEVGSRAFYLAYHGRDDRALQERLARLMLRACPALGWQAPHCAPYRGPGRRIRIGVCSAFLHRHTVGKLYRGLIEHLDRRRFEVVVLRPPGPSDDLSAAIDAAADGVVTLSGHLDRARAQVADLALDVLFYPDIGMNPQTVYLAYARLAPVQCVSWGHPDTTGIPNLDVFLSGPGLEPPGADAQYSETLVQLPRLPVCYAAPAPVTAPLSAVDFGLPADARLYACPQSLFKLHPRFDPVLRDLLAADPRAHVLLIASPRRAWDARLRARLAGHIGLGALRRVVTLPRMPTARFQRLLAGADVVLDPPYFGGGNSTFEALAHGAPIVTWPGPFMRGRVTAACYAAIGVEDAVATDLERDYVERAVALATDPSRRQALVDRIRAGRAGLFDDLEAVRGFEAFFADAIERAAAG